MEIKIVIPIIPLFGFDLHYKKYIDNAISELIELNNELEFSIDKIGVFKPTITLIENYKTNYYRPLDAIVFQIIVPVNFNFLNDIKEFNFSPDAFDSEKEKFNLFESHVKEEFQSRTFTFLILTQIAKPGALKTREGDIYINGTKKYNFML